MNNQIRTSILFFVVLVLCGFTEKVSAQGSIDEIISSAANSSSEFAFMYEGTDDFTVKTELDMLFTKEQWNEMMRLNDTTSRKKRKAIRPKNYRWTNREIPYTIYGHFSQRDRNQINLAVNEWNYYTCLRLRPARRGDRNQIRIQNGGGCSSYVGMRGGTQPVSLAPNCRIKKIIVHELGHAIGFQHEQTRPDRDNYVYILKRNIPNSMYYNFQRYTTGYVNDFRVPYDYTSVMHYGAYAFSYNGQRTIQTKNSRYQNIIGKAPGLSFRDIKLANLMYQCGGHCGSKSCPSPGFLDKNCVCICPGPSATQPTRKCSGGGGGGGGEDKDCVDKNSNCQDWASKGECQKNPKYMLVNCKKSCKKCNGGGGGGGGGGNKDCVDKNSQCSSWAGKGECQKNPDYMLVNCKKSCKQCEDVVVSCSDGNRHCSYWASIGECRKNPTYMSVNCKKSCNKCASSGGDNVVIPKELECNDENSQCSAWAARGECQANPNYMLQYCKKSCQHCSARTYSSESISSESISNCFDYNTYCNFWATLGECSKNPAYMMTSCPKSCKACTPQVARRELPCVDLYNTCASWKSYCTDPAYKAFMFPNCPKTCNRCT